MAEFDLKKAFRQELRAKVWPPLKQVGFDDFSDLSAYRHDKRWIDSIRFATLSAKEFGYPRYLGAQEYATDATFQLRVGTYYLDVHRLPWMGDRPARPRFPMSERATPYSVHRDLCLAGPRDGRSADPHVFRVEMDGSNMAEVLEAAQRALVERGLPWLAQTHDIESYMSGEYSRSRPKPREYDFTEEERHQIQEWAKSQGIEGPNILAFGYTFPPEILALYDRERSKDPPRDHEGDLGFATDEVLWGLLIGSGRTEEALSLLRKAANPKQLEEYLRTKEELYRSIPEMKSRLKREMTRERKVGTWWMEKRANELRLLEEALARQGAK